MNSESRSERLRRYESKKNRLVQEFLSKEDIRLGKITSNLFRHRKTPKSTLNVRDFNKVIHVDTENLIIEVEGMTTYEELVREALKYGVIPTVVPELKTITIGGAVTGVGIESSSFRYGLVHETIMEMEVLLGNGTLALCTPTNKHKDLFFGFPNSYGTLGYALKIKVKVVPVKKYVELTHIKFTHPKEYFAKFEELCRQPDWDFIDGTVFNENEMYVTLGNFTEKAPFVSDYTYMKMYYKSIKQKEKDYLTTLDYIWRWDTDWFWCSKHFGVQNKFIRFFAGRKWLNSETYWKIRAWNGRTQIADKIRNLFGRSRKESVVQDVEFPIESCENFLDFFHKQIGIKPVWICPVKTYDSKVKFDLFQMDPSKLYLNFGFWDMVKTTEPDGYYNRQIENKVGELKGHKSLYSTVFYSKPEFDKIYNRKKYDLLKKKYDPKSKFKDFYDKCVLRS
jgi:FAD/FMN-containing dehydrogenase